MNINRNFYQSILAEQGFIQPQQFSFRNLLNWTEQHPTVVKTIQIASVIFCLWVGASLSLSFTIFAFYATVWALADKKFSTTTCVASRALGLTLNNPSSRLVDNLNSLSPLDSQPLVDQQNKKSHLPSSQEFNLPQNEILKLPNDEEELNEKNPAEEIFLIEETEHKKDNSIEDLYLAHDDQHIEDDTKDTPAADETEHKKDNPIEDLYLPHDDQHIEDDTKDMPAADETEHKKDKQSEDVHLSTDKTKQDELDLSEVLDSHADEVSQNEEDEFETAVDSADNVEIDQNQSLLTLNLSQNQEIIPHPYYQRYQGKIPSCDLDSSILQKLSYKNFAFLLFALSPIPSELFSSWSLLQPTRQNSLSPRKVKTQNAKHSLSSKFQDNETEYGEEIVERQNAIESLKEILNRQIEMLEQNASELNRQFQQSPCRELLTKRRYIKTEIDLCKKSLESSKHLAGDFIGTNFFRKELEKIIGQTNNYAKLINEICTAAPVNFRYHQCRTSHQKIGFFRLGVITDQKNGLTNLKELKELANNRPSLDKKITQLKEKFQHLSKDFKKNYAMLNAYNYALSQLDPYHIQTTIQERRHTLSCQMLQLIQGQIEKNLKIFSDDPSQPVLNPLSTFDLIHLGLLNPKLNDIRTDIGWVHDEFNQIMDMHEIFSEFNGKTIFFDGKGPCIDSDGNIHVNQLLKNPLGNVRWTTLRTHFINISVQGHTKNDGLQQLINQKSMPELIKIAHQKAQEHPSKQSFQSGLQLLLTVQKNLKKSKSNYSLAESFSVAILKLELVFSMGCFGAKDRTGLVAGRTAVLFIHEELENHPKLKKQPKVLHKLKKRFSESVLSKDKCAARIAYENTQMDVLKCSPIILPGFGPYRRFSYYGEQAKAVVASRKK